MDISRLPRLSNTSAPPASPPPEGGEAPPVPAAAASQGYCTACGQPRGPGLRFCGHCGAPTEPAAWMENELPGSGLEAWFCGIIGLVFLLIGRRFGAWLLATMSGQPFETGITWIGGEQAGQPVTYWDLSHHVALSEMALFTFGAAMILEAVVLLLARSRGMFSLLMVGLALLVAAAATAVNLYAIVVLFGAGIMPLLSILAAGFGAYMVVFEVRLLRFKLAVMKAEDARVTRAA